MLQVLQADSESLAGWSSRSASELAKSCAEQASSRFFRDKVRIRWTKFPSSLAKVPRELANHTLPFYSHATSVQVILRIGPLFTLFMKVS